MEPKEFTNEKLIKELLIRLKAKDSEDKYQSEYMMEQLAIANSKLNEAEAIKTNFISNVTNEIVNPFSSILGLSRNIISLKGDNLEKAKAMASLIQSEAFDLDFQLKNIFAAAKFEAGQLIPEYSNVDISTLLKSVIEVYKYKADYKQINVEFIERLKSEKNKKLVFITDSEKIKLIVSNLLSNSIKYSNATDKIIIDAVINDNGLEIKIKDHGIGIDKKNMEIIFDRFKKVNLEINSLVQGHGLGLSIVKASLDILSGDINVKSKLGQGSQFTITVPLAQGISDIDMFASDSDEMFFTSDEIF